MQLRRLSLRDWQDLKLQSRAATPEAPLTLAVPVLSISRQLWSVSRSSRFSFSRRSYKQNYQHIVSAVLVLPLRRMRLRSCVVFHVSVTPFHCLVLFHYVNVLWFVYPLAGGRLNYLDCFKCLANKTCYTQKHAHICVNPCFHFSWRNTWEWDYWVDR